MLLNGGELNGRRYLSEAAFKELTKRQTPQSVARELWLRAGGRPRLVWARRCFRDEHGNPPPAGTRPHLDGAARRLPRRGSEGAGRVQELGAGALWKVNTLMKTGSLCRLCAVSVLLIASVCLPAAGKPVRQRILMDAGWRFHRGDLPGASMTPQGPRVEHWRWIADKTAGADAEKMTDPALDISDWKDANHWPGCFWRRPGFCLVQSQSAGQSKGRSGALF